jgi:hypothetical protein
MLVPENHRRIGQRAHERDVGITEARIRRHGEGAVGVTQGEDAAGLGGRRHGRLLVRALGIPRELIHLLALGVVFLVLLVGVALCHGLGAGAGGLVRLRAGILLLLRHDLVERNALAQRRHVDAHLHLVLRVIEIDVALVEGDGIEFQLPLGGAAAFGQLEGPGVRAVLATLQRDGWLAEADLRDDDAMRDQREGCESRCAKRWFAAQLGFVTTMSRAVKCGHGIRLTRPPWPGSRAQCAVMSPWIANGRPMASVTFSLIVGFSRFQSKKAMNRMIARINSRKMPTTHARIFLPRRIIATPHQYIRNRW